MTYFGVWERLAYFSVLLLLIANSCSSDRVSGESVKTPLEGTLSASMTAFQPVATALSIDVTEAPGTALIASEIPGFAPTADNIASVTLRSITETPEPVLTTPQGEEQTQPEEPTPAVTAPAEADKPFFDRFVDTVKNGNPDLIVGVHVENILALRVVQQPRGKPAFVSPIKGVATEFLLAFEVAGNIGLLAHNYLSGALFFNMKPGDIVQLVYGDGSVVEYEVTTIHEYQALNPLSPSSDFVDLDTGETVTASTLFDKMYGGEHHLTFQTCIDRDGDDSWGRLFVIAMPL